MDGFMCIVKVSLIDCNIVFSGSQKFKKEEDKDWKLKMDLSLGHVHMLYTKPKHKKRCYIG